MTEGRALAESVCESARQRGLLARCEVPLETIGPLMRADVLTLQPGFLWPHSDVCVYEIKTSRGDFLADRNRGKTLNYRHYAHRVYYLGDHDVFNAIEVPRELGVARPGPNGEIEIERDVPPGTPAPNIDLILYLLGRECGALRPVG